MPSQSFVELKDLQIAVRIGTYGPDDIVPDAHLLDLTLTIAPHLVMIDRDEMALVFDYDPLILQIDALARANHYETQERLMTSIVEACIEYPQIEALDISLRKRPVLSGTGTLGVRLIVDSIEMAALRDAGVQVDEHRDGIRVSSDGKLKPLTLSTAPFPAFPTDMQAQFMAMLTKAEGASVLTETIFENRYMHVPELARMGADISVNGRTAVVRGVDKLVGAPVMATDLRASMSLILAGLAAEGETIVSRVYHLDRGYERLEEKLSAVGADIERVSDG